MDINLINTSLSALSTPLTFRQAKHLMDRATFGAAKQSIQALAGRTAGEAVSVIASAAPVPDPPVSMDAKDLDIALGQTWVNLSDNADYRSYRLKSLRSWWIGNMNNQTDKLTEKMTLFWHNHFATETVVVNRPRHLYHYNTLLRQHALGNFKQLLREITVCPAMLVYLDGDENRVGAANENYARELFELFSIGKGPLITPGNYTNYTESDIQEAARVLTGWQVNQANSSSFYTSSRHDKTAKTFSEIYNNQTITNQDADEYKVLIDMILTKKESARYIVRKIYRWFVYYEITPEIESSIIEPLATLLFENNYEVKPVISRLLESEHFYSEGFIGAYIKNPLEFTLGIFRKAQISLSADKLKNYEMWNTIYSQAVQMEMSLGDPPDVAGWPQYYLAPQYNRLWINSATIPARTVFSDKMFDSGYVKDSFKYVVNPLVLADWVNNPSVADDLIRDLAEVFLPVTISQDNINKLKEVLIPGKPDSEWTQIWNAYIGDPGNATKKNAVVSAMNKMLAAMCRMAEFYLC